MSYERGWQALNLQMPDRIPHTEYVSNPAWVKRLTGLDMYDPAQAAEAAAALVREWDYDLRWFTMAPPNQPRLTHMGTAVWRDGYEVIDNRVCPFAGPEDVLSFDPVEAIGIMPHDDLVEHFARTWRHAQEQTPTAVVPGGYYNTIFSWCILTFGWDLFLTAAALDEERFDRVLEGFCELSMASFRAQAQCGCKVFICHDDIVWTSGAVFRPEWYREHVFPRYRKLWQPLKDAGIIILFCSDGDYTEFIDDLADCGADGFIFEPMTDLQYVVEHYGQSKVIIGNIDCRILTFGSEDDIRAEVKRCADLGRDCPGYFFAVGNHIPYNVPVESIAVYAEAIRELGWRG
ncbi:MAG: uroporphyrinogen decarboxylase family protein [Armatimonadota bacterium]